MDNHSNGRGAANDGFGVSVVIPLYNKAAFMGTALESVLAQSCQAAEILVVDDGSTDGGPETVETFGPEHVRLIRQPNAGPGIARNRGIAHATQPWIAFLDADDLWLPDHLAHLAALHRAFPAIAVLATGYEELWDEAPEVLTARDPGEGRKVDFFALDPAAPGLSSSSVAVNADALRAAGGFGASFPGEDVELWIRLGLDHPVVLSSHVTALYRRENQGLTHDYLSTAEPERLPIFATLDAALADPRHRGRYDLISRYRDRWTLVLARQALARGNAGQARASLREVRDKDAQWLFLAALAALPRAVLRGAIKARRMVR